MSMDLNRIALWMAALPALSLFWRSVRSPQRPLGWLLVTALVLVAAIGGFFSFPDYAGYVSGTLAFAFILVPIWAHNAAGRASARFEYRRARLLFGIAALLHPLDGWTATPRLIRAFELAHAGRTAEADALLQVLGRGQGRVASTANAQRLHLLGRWRDLKLLVERNGLSELGREPTLLSHYLRALGELGEVETLAEFMRAHEPLLLATGSLEMGVLSLFAFTGQVELTRRVLGAHAPHYTDETRDLWLAIAHKEAGQFELARRAFVRLRDSTHAQLRERAELHLTSLTRQNPAPEPSARTLAIVEHFAHTLAQRQNILPNGRGQRAPRQMTWLLVGLNTLVYLGGAYPDFVDTREPFAARWAFFAPAVLSGQWWRLVSYLFVHANALHLVMNMAGIWVLGPFVERAFGRLRFGLIYFISGCTGSAFYLTFSAFGWLEPEQLVGASGCIMGLLGATAAVMLRAWFKQRAAIARQIFFRLLLAVALQVAFDLSTPQVAGLAHALGLLGGFLAGLLLREGVSPKRSVLALT